MCFWIQDQDTMKSFNLLIYYTCRQSFSDASHRTKLYILTTCLNYSTLLGKFHNCIYVYYIFFLKSPKIMVFPLKRLLVGKTSIPPPRIWFKNIHNLNWDRLKVKFKGVILVLNFTKRTVFTVHIFFFLIIILFVWLWSRFFTILFKCN